MEQLRKLAWEGMLNADKCVRYYDALAGRFHARDLYSKIFLATMSSGTVAGWAIWSDVPALWKVLSGGSAILAVALPILNISKKVEVANRLKSEFGDIQRDYEMLWAKIDDESPKQVETELRRIWQKEAKLAPFENTMPGNDKTLIRECQREVVHARGL